MCKNPDDDGRNLIGMFDTNSKWYAHIDSQAYAKNSILRTKVAKTKAQPLVDPTKSFLDNYQAISNFLRNKFNGGCTRIVNSAAVSCLSILNRQAVENYRSFFCSR